MFFPSFHTHTHRHTHTDIKEREHKLYFGQENIAFSLDETYCKAYLLP